MTILLTCSGSNSIKKLMKILGEVIQGAKITYQRKKEAELERSRNASDARMRELLEKQSLLHGLFTEAEELNRKMQDVVVFPGSFNDFQASQEATFEMIGADLGNPYLIGSKSKVAKFKSHASDGIHIWSIETNDSLIAKAVELEADALVEVAPVDMRKNQWVGIPVRKVSPKA